MTLVAVTAAKGTLGATTTAVLLSAVWPSPSLLVDADLFGGDIALRLRDPAGQWLSRDRGLVGLATASRADGDEADVLAHTQEVAGGLRVLVGVDSHTQTQAMTHSWPAIVETLAYVDGYDVIADCGRLVPETATDALLARAELVLLLTQPTVEALAHTRDALAHLSRLRASQRSGDVRVVVSAGEVAIDRAVRDVGDALTAAGHVDVVLGGLPHDPRAAKGLAGVPTRALDRSALVAGGRALTAEAAGLLLRRSAVGADLVGVSS